MVLDDRWNVGYWERTGIAPGRSCDACARRASIHVVGGRDDDFPDGVDSWLDDRPAPLRVVPYEERSTVRAGPEVVRRKRRSGLTRGLGKRRLKIASSVGTYRSLAAAVGGRAT